MSRHLVQVTRILHLAVEAESPAEALNKASAEAWSWRPESAAYGKQGRVTLKLGREERNEAP